MIANSIKCSKAECTKKFLQVNGVLSNGMWFCSNSCSEAFKKLHALSEKIAPQPEEKKTAIGEPKLNEDEEDIGDLLSLET